MGLAVPLAVLALLLTACGGTDDVDEALRLCTDQLREQLPLEGTASVAVPGADVEVTDEGALASGRYRFEASSTGSGRWRCELERLDGGELSLVRLTTEQD